MSKSGTKINQFNNRTLLLLRGGKKYRRSIAESGYFVLLPNRDPVGELYRLFPQLPPGEKPLNGFTCALQKDILLQGKMIICTNCICFHSNIFGYETKVIIYLKNVLNIQREKTVFIVPNAISIVTLNKRYFFCSFLSRETVFKLLMRKWKVAENLENLNPKNSFPESKTKDCKHTKKVKNTYGSSNSYDSSMFNLQSSSILLERPHTSTPCFRETYKSERNYLKRCFGVNKDVFCLDNDIFEYENKPYKALCKSQSISDIRELAVLRKKLGIQKIAIADEELNQLHKIAVQDKQIISKAMPFEISYNAFFDSIQCKHSSVILMGIFISMLFIITLLLMMRINSISNQLNVRLNLKNNNETIKFEQLYLYHRQTHSDKIKQIKSTLSINLQTILKVRKVLNDLNNDLLLMERRLS